MRRKEVLESEDDRRPSVALYRNTVFGPRTIAHPRRRQTGIGDWHAVQSSRAGNDARQGWDLLSQRGCKKRK